jgi:hypothetical protein
MHQVLQRTRPALVPSPKPSSKLGGLLRFFLAGRRGLVLLAVVGGASLGSQALMGLLRQAPQPLPGRPEGREEASADGVGARHSAAASPAATGAAPAPAGHGAAKVPGRPASAAGSVPRAAAVASRPRLSLPGWARPWRSRHSAPAAQAVIADSRTELPARAASAAPLAPPISPPARAGLSRRDGARQLGNVNLADLDPSLGVPCSNRTAALPSDRPSEEAWLPGRDTAGLSAAALDPIPVPPIYSESPELAVVSSSRSLPATSNTPCLLKQPAGRN